MRPAAEYKSGGGAVSEPAATRAVDQMRDAAVLTPWNSHRRDRTFYAPGIADTIDEWARVY